MPKETFFNLPEEKRELLIQLAIEEFLVFRYEGFSISRFVEKAGIAKGSFYQYFTGKEDLYRFIIELAGQRKLRYITALTHELEALPFFDLLKAIYMGSYDFLKAEYQLAAIVDRFLKSSDSQFKEKILGDSLEKSNLFVEAMLKTAIEQGELQPQMDIPYTAFIITSFSVALSDYALSQVSTIQELGKDSYSDLVDKTIALLASGIHR